MKTYIIDLVNHDNGMSAVIRGIVADNSIDAQWKALEQMRNFEQWSVIGVDLEVRE